MSPEKPPRQDTPVEIPPTTGAAPDEIAALERQLTRADREREYADGNRAFPVAEIATVPLTKDGPERKPYVPETRVVTWTDRKGIQHETIANPNAAPMRMPATNGFNHGGAKFARDHDATGKKTTLGAKLLGAVGLGPSKRERVEADAIRNLEATHRGVVKEAVKKGWYEAMAPIHRDFSTLVDRYIEAGLLPDCLATTLEVETREAVLRRLHPELAPPPQEDDEERSDYTRVENRQQQQLFENAAKNIDLSPLIRRNQETLSPEDAQSLIPYLAIVSEEGITNAEGPQGLELLAMAKGPSSGTLKKLEDMQKELSEEERVLMDDVQFTEWLSTHHFYAGSFKRAIDNMWGGVEQKEMKLSMWMNNMIDFYKNPRNHLSIKRRHDYTVRFEGQDDRDQRQRDFERRERERRS